MKKRGDEAPARYAVDVRGVSIHAEIDDLANILSVVDGHAGRAHVIDRQTGALVFHGTMDELREAMRPHAARVTEESTNDA